MLNYAIISEAITNQINEVKAKIDYWDTITNKTMNNILDLESRYIDGEDVGIKLDKAYREHDKAMNAFDDANEALKHLNEAKNLYTKTLLHIEYAKSVM